MQTLHTSNRSSRSIPARWFRYLREDRHDLCDLVHVTGWERHDLHALANVSGVGRICAQNVEIILDSCCGSALLVGHNAIRITPGKIFSGSPC